MKRSYILLICIITIICSCKKNDKETTNIKSVNVITKNGNLVLEVKDQSGTRLLNSLKIDDITIIPEKKNGANSMSISISNDIPSLGSNWVLDNSRYIGDRRGDDCEGISPRLKIVDDSGILVLYIRTTDHSDWSVQLVSDLYCINDGADVPIIDYLKCWERLNPTDALYKGPCPK